jgi:hypothetical protein
MMNVISDVRISADADVSLIIDCSFSYKAYTIIIIFTE